MKLLRTLVHDAPTCAYLHDRPSSLDAMIAVEVSPSELSSMLARGWRRFGPTYFRPRCAHCSECVGLRVRVADWKPSRSQRRVINHNADIELVIDAPSVTDERLALYRRWHAFRERERGWEPSALDARSYEIEFAFRHRCAREFSYWIREGAGERRLIAVGLVDEVPDALSAVYCYYDPAEARRSLGVLNVITQIQVARARNLSYVYLGYRVAPCPSMAYKARFEPHELLFDRPREDERPAWVSP